MLLFLLYLISPVFSLFLFPCSKSTVITGRPNSHYPPAISGDGNGVIITYPGGDKCSDAGTYNTTILLSCSDEEYVSVGDSMLELVTVHMVVGVFFVKKR